MTCLQQRLVKTGVRLMNYARYDWLLLAEGQLTRQRFASMLSKDCSASAAERLANQATRGTAQPAAVPLNHTNGEVVGQVQSCRQSTLKISSLRTS